MPKIRSIHPDFWTDSKILKLSPLDRLFYIGLWNFCDDDGVFQFDESQLGLRILPLDNGWEGVLQRLVNLGLVKVLSVRKGEDRYAIVLHFSKYQKVNKNWHKHTFESGDLTMFEETTVVQPLDNGGPTAVLVVGLGVGSGVGSGRVSNETLVVGDDVQSQKKVQQEKDIDYLWSEYERIAERKVIARPKRLPRLRSALKTFSVEDIRKAWAKMSVDKYLRGENPGARDYFTIDYALRIEKIESYLIDFNISHPEHVA